ncbi:MAG: aromatic amino acid lyase [Burkholderiales bacterium]|nr:aromatic amino acid lyase [Burkholderiales bacterium]
MNPSLTLHPGKMSLDDLRAVWQAPTTVTLAPEAHAAIAASAAAVQNIVGAGKAAYGINTGFKVDRNINKRTRLKKKRCFKIVLLV